MPKNKLQNDTLKCQRNLFSIPDNISYLNCSYMAPQLKSITDIGIKALKRKELPYEIIAQDFFDSGRLVRESFAKLIGAHSADSVAIIPSVSYGISTIASNIAFKKNDKILLAHEQFPSNVYPWTAVADKTGALVQFVKATGSKERGKTWNEQFIDQIDKKTRVVSIGQVHWADGTAYDLKAIRKKTNEVGAYLIVDGTQSVGMMPFDVKSIKPDALICAGYKWLLGPYSIALGYFGPMFHNGDPLEENWINRYKSENFAGLVKYQSRYKPKAQRFNMGENSQFINAPMLLEALNQIHEWGQVNLENYCRELAADPIKRMMELGCRIEDEKYRGTHLFGIRLPKNTSTEKINSGFQRNKIFVSIRGNAIRVGIHVYNNENDMDKLVGVLEKNL